MHSRLHAKKGEKLIKSVGYKADTVPFIPVSGWKGDNLVKKIRKHVLVLSAKEGETDTAIAPGGQAREHAFLLKTLGVKQIIVAINKMDDSNYSEDAFKAARKPVGFSSTVNSSNASSSVLPLYQDMFSDFLTRLSPFHPDTGMNGTVSAL